jgi:hypothetical protein
MTAGTNRRHRSLRIHTFGSSTFTRWINGAVERSPLTAQAPLSAALASASDPAAAGAAIARLRERYGDQEQDG